MCDCLHKKNNTSLINKFDGGGAVIHTADGDDCDVCKRAKKLVDGLKEKGYTDRIVDYYGVRVRERIQANKGVDKGTYTRYHLAINGDKSTAVKINSYLDEDEVLGLYRRSLEDKFRDGGIIDAKRRFTDNDFSRLTENEFESSRVGDVWSITKVDSTRILGRYNPEKQYVYILGKKDLTNPLVKWLSENSYVTNGEFYKLVDGGGINKYTEAQRWWGNDLSLNEQKEYAKKHLLNFEYSELMGYPSYSTGERRKKFIEKIWEGEGKPKSIVSGLYKDGGYIKLTTKEKERLNELQKREDVDILTKSENEEYDNLVKKYRMTKEYKGGSENKKAIVLSISSSNPLSTQLNKITGDSYNSIDFEDLDKGNPLVIKHIKTGDIFVVFNESYISQVDDDVIKDNLDWVKLAFGVNEFDYRTGLIKFENGGGVGESITSKEFGERAKTNETLEYKYSIIRKWSDNMISDEDIDGVLNALVLGGVTDADLHTKPTKTGRQYLKAREEKTKELMDVMEKNYTGRLKGNQPYMPIYTMVDMATRFNDNIIERFKAERMGKETFGNGGAVEVEGVSDTYSDLRFSSKAVIKSKEIKVKDNLNDGEISVFVLKRILGFEPNYPTQVVGSIRLTKCFLRNYYKI